MTSFDEKINDIMHSNFGAAAEAFKKIENSDKRIQELNKAMREDRESRRYCTMQIDKLQQEKEEVLATLQESYNKGVEDAREFANTIFAPDPSKLTDEVTRYLSYIDLTEDETRAAILKAKKDCNFTLMRALISKGQRLGYDIADDTPEFIAKTLEQLSNYNGGCMQMAQDKSYMDMKEQVLAMYIPDIKTTAYEWENSSGYTKEAAALLAQERDKHATQE